MKIGNKSKVFIGLFFIVLLFLGGRFFYDYLNYKKELEEQRKWQELIAVEHEPLDNYKIVEELNGQRIVNENIGISFLVPEGWNIEKKEGSLNNPENYITLSSPDLIINKIGDDLEYILRGCWIGIYATSDYFENVYIKEKISGIKNGEYDNVNKSVLEIGGHLGIKEPYDKNYYNEELDVIESLFPGIYLTIPLGQKMNITIHTIFSEIEKERCLEGFDNLIENTSIR